MIGEGKLPSMSLVRMCEALLRAAEIKTIRGKAMEDTAGANSRGLGVFLTCADGK